MKRLERDKNPHSFLKRLLWRFQWLKSHWFLGLCVLALFVTHHLSNEPLIESLRLKTFDFYQQLLPRDPSKAEQAAEVGIIDIDDATLQEVGQWPWSRKKIARLVNNLTELNAAVIGFDIVFAERDRLSPDMVAKELENLPAGMKEELEQLPSNDAILAEAFENGRVVVGQAGVHTFETDLSTLTRKVTYAERNGDPRPFLHQYTSVVRNLPELEKAARGIGLFSIIPDDDGVYRKVSLVERVGDMIYPALSLEMLRVALGSEDSPMVFMHEDASHGIEKIILKTAQPGVFFEIPTDRTGTGKVWVHFAKHPQPGSEQFDPDNSIYISAKDVMNLTPENRARLHPRIAGKLLIVGTSATGLKDIRPTPIDGKMPGVEVHAQLLETILAQSHLTRTTETYLMEVLMIIVGGLMMIVLVPRLNALYTFLFCAALIAAQVWLAWYFYTEHRELVDASYPSLSLFGMFVFLSYLNYMAEERERGQIKNAFGHYVSPALLEELAADPESLQLGGEIRELTVMFSDIRGFTTISEQFDAHGLTQFINKFLTPMTDVIMEHNGTIDKYMGDAIMAFWNAPMTVDEHAYLACIASLKMQQAVKELNTEMEEQAYYENRKHIPINIGVGINSGPCCVGNMGSEQRFDYSTLGDDVNLASRLEGQSKTYGVDVVVGENTKALLDDRLPLIELDLLQVKGKTEPVYIYALMGDEAYKESSEFKAISFANEEMIAAYREQRWDNCIALAEKSRELDPGLGVLSDLYIERCNEYKKNPPPAGWNGVFIATSK